MGPHQARLKCTSRPTPTSHSLERNKSSTHGLRLASRVISLTTSRSRELLCKTLPSMSDERGLHHPPQRHPRSRQVAVMDLTTRLGKGRKEGKLLWRSLPRLTRINLRNGARNRSARRSPLTRRRPLLHRRRGHPSASSFIPLKPRSKPGFSTKSRKLRRSLRMAFESSFNLWTISRLEMWT